MKEKNKTNVFGRNFNKRPKPKGEIFTKKSMTIPGQEMTPQEIMRMFTKERPRSFYSELPLHEHTTLDPFERLDILRSLNTKQQELQAEINRLRQETKPAPKENPVISPPAE